MHDGDSGNKWKRGLSAWLWWRSQCELSISLRRRRTCCSRGNRLARSQGWSSWNVRRSICS